MIASKRTVAADPLTGAVGYQLKRAQHGLRLAMDRALRRRGLTTPQYAVLEALDDSAGLSGAELARRAFVTPQTMNDIVAGLERAGLVERRPHPAHGRILQSDLTLKARALVRAARRDVLAIESQMVRGLSAEERRSLLELLRNCADSLGNTPSKSPTKA